MSSQGPEGALPAARHRGSRRFPAARRRRDPRASCAPRPAARPGLGGGSGGGAGPGGGGRGRGAALLPAAGGHGVLRG